MFLSKKIYRLLGALLFCFALSKPVEAQLKKGDYHLNVRGLFQFSGNDFLGESTTFGNLELTYLKMMSDRFMFGGELLYGLNSFSVAGGFPGGFSFNSFEFNQITRYYFATGQLAPFVNLENTFQLYTYDRLTSSDIGYGLNLGIGLDYFIRPNIALEGSLKVNLFSTEDILGFENLLSFDLGLKLFFNSKFFGNPMALPERILKKGNIISTTRLNFIRLLDDDKDDLMISSPNIRYFLSDRLNIFGGYTRQRSSSESFSGDRNISNSLNFSLSVSYYLPLTDKLFWNFEVGNIISMSGEKLSKAFDNGIEFISTPLSTSLHYFSGPAKLYGGINYVDQRFKSGGDIIKIGRNLQFFVGLDYYVTDYIFLNVDARLNNLKSEFILINNQSFGLDFGVGFILGKSGDKSEEKEVPNEM